MLFAGGMAIPPGTKSLADYIDQNDPCTINPNDPVCQATAQDTANDPCRANPSLPYCQGGVMTQTANTPMPDASSWNQYIDSGAASSQTPSWVAQLVNAISNNQNRGTTLNPVQGKTSGIAAALGKIPWKPLLIGALIIGGGYFAATKFHKKRGNEIGA